MAEQQEQEGGVPKHVNLTRYRTIRQELYNQLTDEERLAYEAKAAEKNKARKTLPERSENFKYVDPRRLWQKLTHSTETKRTSSAES